MHPKAQPRSTSSGTQGPEQEPACNFSVPARGLLGPLAGVSEIQPETGGFLHTPVILTLIFLESKDSIFFVSIFPCSDKNTEDVLLLTSLPDIFKLLFILHSAVILCRLQYQFISNYISNFKSLHFLQNLLTNPFPVLVIYMYSSGFHLIKG